MMKKQGSSTSNDDGSVDEPSLSRESSTELYTDSTGTDLRAFLVDTLQKKDRGFLLTIEKQLTALVKDSEKTSFKFQHMPNPYYRMLVHRVAAFFGFDHNVDRSSECVVVCKTKNTRIPDLKFDDIPVLTVNNNDVEPKKLLRREMAFDNGQDKDRSPDRRGTLNDYKSKSFEEREVMYNIARERIFNQQDSLSSNDGGDTSVGGNNTASSEGAGGGRSPSLLSVAGGVPTTTDSSLDDLRSNSKLDIRPWSSVDSDGSTRHPKLGREYKRSFELDPKSTTVNTGSAATSPSGGGGGGNVAGGMSYLKPNGYLSATTSSSATELAPRERYHKLPKASSFGGISRGPTLSRENSIHAGPEQSSTPRLSKAVSLNLSSSGASGDHQHFGGGGHQNHQNMRRGASATIYENAQSTNQAPLLANPHLPSPHHFVSSSSTSHKLQHHQHHSQHQGPQQWASKGRRSDNNSQNSFRISGQSNVPLAPWPATVQDPSNQPSYFVINPHLSTSLHKDQQQQLPPQQQLYLHQVASYLQQTDSNPNTQRAQQQGPVFYGIPGQQYSGVKLADPRNNMFPSLQQLSIALPTANQPMVAVNHSGGVPSGTAVASFLPSHSAAVAQAAQIGQQQQSDIRYYYQPNVVMISGPPPPPQSQLLQHRPGNQGPHYSTPIQGPVTVQQAIPGATGQPQFIHHPQQQQSGQGGGGALLPMPFAAAYAGAPAANQSVGNNHPQQHFAPFPPQVGPPPNITLNVPAGCMPSGATTTAQYVNTPFTMFKTSPPPNGTQPGSMQPVVPHQQHPHHHPGLSGVSTGQPYLGHHYTFVPQMSLPGPGSALGASNSAMYVGGYGTGAAGVVGNPSQQQQQSMNRR